VKGVNEELKKVSSRSVFLLLIVLLLFMLSSCSVPFVPQVPPASYSTDAAVNVLSNKYYLLDSGEINGFGDIALGDGRYAVFDGVDGILMIFRYDSKMNQKRSGMK